MLFLKYFLMPITGCCAGILMRNLRHRTQTGSVILAKGAIFLVLLILIFLSIWSL